MAWTTKQKKAHSERMKNMWAKKALDKMNTLRVGDDVLMQDGSVARLLPLQDMVNHPAHYTFSKYEVADVSDEWYGKEPLLWNANKYMARWDKKGDPVENLEKAIWYLQRKITQLKAGV